MKQRLFNRNFTLLILGQVSSLIGNYTLKFALSMYVLEQTGSATIFASLLAISMLPTILLSPFGGMLADRMNRRNLMVLLDTLSALSVLTALFAMSSVEDLWVIGGLLIMLSILGAFESPTVQACIPQLLSHDQIVKGNVVVNQVSSIAALITPFLGSIAYSQFGLPPIFVVAIVSFFITAFFECFIQLDSQPPQPKQKLLTIIKEDFSLSVHFLRHEQPSILNLLLLAAIVSLLIAGTVVVGFPYLVRTVLGLSANAYGFAESMMGIASILGSLCVAMVFQHFQLRRLAFVFALTGIALSLGGVVFIVPFGKLGQYLLLLVLFSLTQGACSFFSTLAISIIQERTPEALMGKVMAYVFTLSMCAQPIGQLIYGFAFDCFQAQPCWVLLPSGLLVIMIAYRSFAFFRSLEHSSNQADRYEHV